MRRWQRLGAAAAWLVLAAAAAPAATIFRCGNSYSQTPCADAKAIETPAPATDAQRVEARAVAAREKQLALDMVRERRERESALRPATAASLGPAHAAPAASAPPPRRDRRRKHVAPPADDRDFIAAVPGPRK